MHPLSRQIQRYALFVTLARYDARSRPSRTSRALALVAPIGARSRFHLVSDLRWHDGVPTTARDVAFTLDAARDPATGFPRAADLAERRDASPPATTRRSTLHFAHAAAALPARPLRAADRAAHLPRAHVRARDMRARQLQRCIRSATARSASCERVAGQRWVLARNDAFPRRSAARRRSGG